MPFWNWLHVVWLYTMIEWLKQVVFNDWNKSLIYKNVSNYNEEKRKDIFNKKKEEEKKTAWDIFKSYFQ